MKRIVIVFGFLLIGAGWMFAQRIDNTEVLKKFDLTDEEIAKVMEIQTGMEKGVLEVRVELNLIKAQLEKILFGVNVDMQEVERLLRQSLEWKMKAELAEIRRRVEIRKIFGEQRWEKFILALKHRRENREEKNPDPDRRTPSVPKANPKQ